jgi:hypothetical protein
VEPQLFALLLGFTLAKMAIAGGIVWLGLRSPERPPDGDGGDGPPDDGFPPSRPVRGERVRRGAPSRRPDERARARRRAARTRRGGP